MKQFTFAFLFLASIAAVSQPRLPKDYYWQKLDNGLEVVVIENAKVPLATIEIAVKNGAYTEGPEYSGLSHLFEHMFFKANKDYPNQEKFLKRTQELGAIWNGTTDVERVNYYFTFHKDSLDAGLKFMNAAMRYPIYRAEDMQKERPVVDGEFQRAESDPGFQIYYEGQKKLWGDLFTRKNPIGDHNIINTATPEKMMIIKGKYYHPNNSLLTISGDVKHNEVFALVKKIYGSWENSGFNPHEKYPIPAFTPLQSTQYFVKESSIAKTPYMYLVWQGPGFRTDSAGTIEADIFSTILQLNSSKWRQALVDKGLASDASMFYQKTQFPGALNIFILPNPNKLHECYQEVSNQLKMWQQDDYITDEQLADAKSVMHRNRIRAREKPSTLSFEVSTNWCSTSLAYMTDYENNFENITKADLKNYISRYITGKPYVAGIIINAEMNKQYNPTAFFKP